ncbi:MAG: alanine:cation symporter family protein, partial [Pseudomonadota bacterium]
IDTLVICTLTGLVILSSGVWKEKFETDFAPFDTEFVQGAYTDTDPDDVEALFVHLGMSAPADDPVQPLNGELTAVDGEVHQRGFTVIHNRSVAEEVRYYRDGEPYSGPLRVVDGALATPGVTMSGRSLLHSVPLTAEAFKHSFFGEYGQYAVTVGLVLFAFSTALAWSYYGDRSMTYLVGVEAVLPYRLLYVVGFFLATVVDTSLVWLISAVTLALMAIPNLLGLLLMRREVKDLTRAYWSKFQSR